MCQKHHMRVYRYGHTDGLRPRRKQRGVCRIEGCGQVDTGPHQLCSKHHARWQRNGDPEVLRGALVRAGSDNPNWRGSQAGYRAIHERVRRCRGSASAYPCVNCGGRAHHWSYNHQDPNEFEVRHPNGSTYPAGSPDYYDPRCVRCHKAFDLSRDPARNAPPGSPS